ncbi:MAG: divalent-cation tolerance protein CutA [Chlamydiota bacterium]
MKTQVVYLFWTCRDKGEAKKIIHGLFEKHLIACATIIPEVESVYRWEGKIEESHEVKVILKTVSDHFVAIEDYILSHCSYEIPEISQIDLSNGHLSYLSWVIQEVSSSGLPPNLQ